MSAFTESHAAPLRRVQLWGGDCVEMMKRLPDASVDSVVCDPPYGLEFMGKEWDAPWKGGDRRQREDDTFTAGDRRHGLVRHGVGASYGTDPAAAGAAFQAWCQTWAAEALRVLKPGGHMLAFGGTRTYHRLACAIEDAGFEIRDSIHWMYGCLDDQTEILTRTGWVRGTDLDAAALPEVLQWDASTGGLSWVRPSEYRSFRHAGPMVRLTNRHTDQVVTPDHRVYAKIRRHARNAAPTAYEVVAAGDLRNHWQITLPMAGILDGEGGPSPDRAYLAGWYLTDAWDHGDGKAVCFSQSKPKTLAKLQAALAPYGASEYVREPRVAGQNAEHAFYVSGEIAAWLRASFPGREIPWSILSWSREARTALFQGLMDGDGSQPEGQYAHTFWSQRPERRDLFMALALSLGMRAFEGEKDCVYVNTETRTTQLQSKHRVDPVDYDGTVWCVTVPTGAFVARRNGRPFITGNSGFPKSMDISKAIDKAAGAEREVIGSKLGMPGYHLHANNAGEGAYGEGYRSKTPEQRAAEVAITAPATPEAERWAGWGTALKPGHEPIIVARKPLTGTVAANVLQYGTGGLNIDGCRVAAPGEEITQHGRSAEASAECPVYSGDLRAVEPGQTAGQQLGRWPPNVLLSHSVGCRIVGMKPQDVERTFSEIAAGIMPPSFPVYACVEGCPVAALDEQSGDVKGAATTGKRAGTGYHGNYGAQAQQPSYADRGGASRFYPQLNFGEDDDVPGIWPPFLYNAKAPKKERNAGIPGGNKHPTVKPVSVMRWLLRLVTPPGGVVLDPFGGSGTTGVAAIHEGFRIILIEQDPAYCEIIVARMKHALAKVGA